jgi:DNA-binding transcriptional regulator YbjK
MSKKDEALNMAIEAWSKLILTNQSNLECARSWFIEGYVHALVNRKPLSTEHIKSIDDMILGDYYDPAEALDFAREIEKAHRIGD